MKRLGNHAIVDEEATAKVRQTLGTQYMVVINSNGSRALLKEGAGQYKVDESVGSDPTFYEDEAEGEGGDDDNPPKKRKKRGRPPKNKGQGEPGGGGTGGEQTEDEAEQILQSAQRIKTYRMYRTALATENYKSLLYSRDACNSPCFPSRIECIRVSPFKEGRHLPFRLMKLTHGDFLALIIRAQTS